MIGDHAFYCCPNLSSITIKNPYCDIYDNWKEQMGYTICNSYNSSTGIYNYLGVICGYNGSSAQDYAEYFDRTFVSLGENPDNTTTTTTTTSTTTTTKRTTTSTTKATTTTTTTTTTVSTTMAYSNADTGPAAGDLSCFDEFDVDQATVKPTLALSRIELSLEEARANPICTVDLSVIGAAGKYAATGIHINWDSRLSLNGDKKAIQSGEAIKLCHTSAVKIDDNCIFVATAGLPGDGADGVMWSFPLIIPSDCQPGDIYPIQIEYINNDAAADEFSNAPPYYEREQDQLMEAWTFTRGIIQGYIIIKEENATPVDYTLGDVNNDGNINAVDASTVLAYYAMLSTGQDGGFTEAQKSAGDVNNDGNINAIDASCILAYYAYLSTGGKVSLEDFLNRPTINDFPLYKSRLSYIKANSKTESDCINADISTQYSYDTERKYALMDLNGDKSPELITVSGTLSSGAPSISEIYTINNNQLVRLCKGAQRSWYYLCDNNIIACSSVYGMGHGGAYYKYNSGSELNNIESLNYDYRDGSLTITYYAGKTQKTISEAEAKSIGKKYKEIDYELTTF